MRFLYVFLFCDLERIENIVLYKAQESSSLFFGQYPTNFKDFSKSINIMLKGNEVKVLQ